MKFKHFLTEQRKESTGLGADGLSKARLKTLLYKETSKCTKGIYKDRYWQGVKCIWDAFDKLNLNWHITKSDYKNYNKMSEMPDAKVWEFEIIWDDNKGKHKKMGGNVTASGAGSVEDPLDRYDVTMVIW